MYHKSKIFYTLAYTFQSHSDFKVLRKNRTDESAKIKRLIKQRVFYHSKISAIPESQ